jgi:hypothetical protein
MDIEIDCPNCGETFIPENKFIISLEIEKENRLEIKRLQSIISILKNEMRDMKLECCEIVEKLIELFIEFQKKCR